MATRALSFGVRADAYERFRPGYPQELFEMVAAYAGRPLRTALEIGAGTGKATRLFARRGVAVTATEPDAAMLDELRRNVPPGVRTVRAAFEDVRRQVPRDERYGLVYAAAALHWTTPGERWPRVASLLEPGGVFASFGGPVHLADPAVAEAVRAARAPILESDDVPPPDATVHDGTADATAPAAAAPDVAAPDVAAPEAGAPGHGMRWTGTELPRSPWFTDVEQHVIARRLTMSADDYVGHLSTVSAYLTLPPVEREAVFRRIARVLPRAVGISADITVHLARRRPDG